MLFLGAIESVILFRQGARVRRVVEAPADATELLVGPLPLEARDVSLRVRASGAQVDAARMRLEVVGPTADAPPAQNEELEAARLEEAKLTEELEAVQRALSTLDELRLEPRRRTRGEPPAEIPIEARLDALSTRHETSLRWLKRVEELGEQLRLASERRAELEQADARLGTARSARKHEVRKVVELSLSGAKAGAQIRLDYDVPSARWYPVYTLRLDERYERASLEARAMVAQCTGEDWKKASLTFSTALPDQPCDLPELRSIRLGRAQPRAQTGYREPPDPTDALYADYDKAFPIAGSIRSALEPSDELLFLDHGGFDDRGFDDRGFGDRDFDDRGFAPMGVAEEDLPFAGAAPVAAAAPPEATFAASVAGLVGGKRTPAPRRSARDRSIERSEPDMSQGLRRRQAVPKAGEGEHTDQFELANELTGEAVPSPATSALWLDFDALVMAAADEPARGELRRETAAERIVAPPSVQRRIEARPPSCVEPRELDGFDHSFAASMSVDLPSDGAHHAVPLDTLESAASRRYIVVPRESRNVFRFVALDEALAAPLLAGPLDIYVGGHFLMSRAMSITPAGEHLELGLGVEQGIEIARNARFTERAVGLIRGSIDLEHDVQIEVRNHLRQPVDLEVRERVPVVRENDDEISVRADPASPPWESWEPADDDAAPRPSDPGGLRGGRRWRVSLAPAGEARADQSLTFRYVIRISGKHSLVGGNRRES